jgi:hypothetical protein
MLGCNSRQSFRHGCPYIIEGREFIKVDEDKRTLKIHSVNFFFNTVKSVIRQRLCSRYILTTSD